MKDLSLKAKLSNYWRKLGPGLITGVSDDDPSGIATYSQAGAGFGLSLLWTALLTYPLMYSVQEMCARIAIASSKSLTGAIKAHYPRYILLTLAALVVPAITFNIAADIASMSAVTHMLIPEIPTCITEWFIAGLSLYFLISRQFNAIVKVLKFLCLSLICYMIVPFLVQQDWRAVFFATFIPDIHWSKDYILILVAILGTTISPYLFFFQASMSLEQKIQNGHSDSMEIKNMKTDVKTGTFVSNLAMYFIILTTGSVLFANGKTQINTVQEAAEALKPLAGDLAYVIFSLGVLGVGLLSIPILGICVGYIIAEIFGWEKGLDKPFKEAKEFYSITGVTFLIAALINLFGIDPIQSLILTAVIYGIITPFLIAMILHIANQKSIMGPLINPPRKNFLGITAFLLMSTSAIILIISWFL